jgi:3-mercaptopyruvate sulfurtransferase SseA
VIACDVRFLSFDSSSRPTGKKSLVDVGGHLPGARLVDFKNVRTERMLGERKVKFLSPEGADFQARMQAAGVVVDKPIVLVPMGQSIADVDEALRLYWTFKLRGEDRVAVLARAACPSSSASRRRPPSRPSATWPARSRWRPSCSRARPTAPCTSIRRRSTRR